MTTVSPQSAYREAESAEVAPQRQREAAPELLSSGAHCDLLEARRGSWAERVARIRQLRDRHPATVHVAVAVTLWVALVVFLAVVGKIVTDLLVPHAGLGAAEQSYNEWLEDQRAPLREDVSWVGSTLSGGYVIPLIVTVTCVTLAFKRWWRLGAFFLTSILIEVTAYRALVTLVPRERPEVDRLESLPIQHSFPSGHVAATVAVYGALALVLAAHWRESRLRYLAYALGVCMPLLVAGSRMYRGMHNPSDALAGLIMGALAVVIAIFVARVVGVVACRREAQRTEKAVYA